ncbi:MAG TPA: tRNA uridine(34) 5-carboxymethylaminomethyl modification radical SAM/GNAT enzyme Elp3 [Candidatus Nanoarchaeia archaeon]|nr:tRNA uridine(34) 5-carboxymethylaminomethyl modification radical SAM/GNAT enzyme Elp3 [Candidatus Nanoarchaeia archaeon]
MAQVLSRILEEMERQGAGSQGQLNRIKLAVVREQHARDVPTNAALLAAASPAQREQYYHLFSTKPTRILSGVNVIAIMTKPLPCPHGKCTYCPGGPGSVFGDVPQSYTGKEPAARRAIRNQFDPYLQVFNRLEQYVATNKVPQKVELIVMAGTFPADPAEYQEGFITAAFQAMNDFGELFFTGGELRHALFNAFFELPGDVHDPLRTARIQEKIRSLRKSTTLAREHERNERAMIRCIGITIESKPDYGRLAQGNAMLALGATRIELGIQNLSDAALQKANRGHTVADSVEATRTLKDLGFKINMHYMPGLFAAPAEDREMMRALFSNPDLRPDMLKIYPVMVLRGTALYNQWKAGAFTPLTTEEAAELIAEFKQHVPRYCRIMRVQRDIPTYMTEAGVGRTNIRQYIRRIMEERGIRCSCIRCREVGLYLKNHPGAAIHPDDVRIRAEEYAASQGTEFFVAAEDIRHDALIGFCRMRFPSQCLRAEITPGAALIRELHVYGNVELLGSSGALQHAGYGKKLLAAAEGIARERGRDKMVVISGIGVREYYRKLGYASEGLYMTKPLAKSF